MNKDPLYKELHFLIAKFLQISPCQDTFKTFIQELNAHDVFPKRLDWTGGLHSRSYAEMEVMFSQIDFDHLLQICKRVGNLIQQEKEKNGIVHVQSLLGMENYSLINNKKTERKYYNVERCAARRNKAPLLEPITFRKHNFLKVLYAREISGPFNRKHFLSGCQYKNMVLLGRTLGHLSAVYCILFDSSGQYIVTGADDLLVKIWHAISGRLLYTLRGASAEITDLAINNESTLLAAGSVDKVVRIWCLQTAYPIATLTIHTGLITSVNFCPSVVNGCRYFASTATDGSVAFWKYATDESGTTSFETTPVQYLERMRPGCAQILCGAFSAGGMFLATGSADHNVRVYKMAGLEGPTRVLETEVHSDRVDSILWAHTHLKFVSGSKDGTSIIWYYHEQRWKYKILCMSTKLPGMKATNEDNKQKIRVTMLSWDKSDQWVITASSDNVIRVWDSCDGHLVQVLQGHRAETYVIESHPLDSKILLSAGHDGKIFLWNIITGEMLTSFQNNIDGHGFGAVFDAKWSPDGSMFSATDSHGQILTFGLGLPDITRKAPRELFFHTDYRPLTRDNNSMVLDEQTQTPPHLMPPPFLVDIDGNPYPPYLQRLVPGREHCDIDQLVPNVVLNDEGRQEVIAGANVAEGDHLPHNLDSRNRSRLRARYGVRFAGDIEGVRQSSGNWQRGDNILWGHRLICKPLDKYAAIALAERVRSLAYLELEEYRRESKRIPDPTPINVETSAQKSRKAPVNHAYRTRASRTEQLQDLEINENLVSSESQEDDSTAQSEIDSSTSSDDSSSTDYSDWTADNGMNKLEPPKRTARVRNIKRAKRMASTTQKKSTAPQDVPEEYRVPDWLSEVYPKKSPYYPQMGDEVMFFQQGYNLYLNAVQNKNIYKVRPAQLNPWRKIKLKEPQLVKIIGIKYEIRPPRLCGLRLAVMDNDQVTEYSFDLKYHDISDVIDFLVIRQVYDTAVARNWKVGDRFRSIIDDAWWLGTIVMRNRNAQSPFLCYRIRWDSGESENLSPWDLEPIGARREPQPGSSLPILPREMKSILYKADSEEWPGGGIEVSCRRILRGLEDLMSMSVAEHFLVPVDISVFPSYAQTIEYPTDLSTIKARLENRFYRRLTAVQFDARYIASNAEKFNERGSEIVKKARIVTETLLKIIKALIPLDVTALVHQLQENYFSAESADEKEDLCDKPGPSTRFQLRSGMYHSSRPKRSCNMKESRKYDWLRECKGLLQLLWISEDGAPFRHPVDRVEHPDYDRIVDTPIDLSMIREELQVGNYRNPVEVCKDIRLMFQNAKNYTPNKKSRIYAMTVRLSGLAETNIKRILYHWKRNTKDKTSDSEIANTPRKSSKRKRQIKDTTEDGDSYSDDQVHRSRLRTTTTSTTTTTTTTTIGDEYPRETRSSGRLRRKIKKIVLSEDKKSDNSTDSEWEKRYSTPTKGTSTRGYKRNLRERKLWNYAKMLESTTDFSDDEPRPVAVNTSAGAARSSRSSTAAKRINVSTNDDEPCTSRSLRRDDGPCTTRSLRRDDELCSSRSLRRDDEPCSSRSLRRDNEPCSSRSLRRDDVPRSSRNLSRDDGPCTSRSLRRDDGPCTSRTLRRDDFDYDASSNDAPARSTVGQAGGSNLTINASISDDSKRKSRSRRYSKNLRSELKRAKTADNTMTSENDLRHHSRLLRRRQVCHYVENTDSSDDYYDYDDDNKDEDVDISVSVSSRGRIRKLTAKARAHVFRDI